MFESKQSSSSEMTFFSPLELQEFGIVAPETFSAFQLEPYRSGVLAASLVGFDRSYNGLQQLTVYCRAGSVRYLLTGTWLSPDEVPATSVAFFAGNHEDLNDATRGATREPLEHLRARTSNGQAYMEIVVPSALHSRATQANYLRLEKFT